MRTLFAAVSFAILAMTAACNPTPSGDDVAAIEAIDDAVGELNAAFEAGDTEAIKALMTEDHVSVTPYYGAPKSVSEQLDSLDQLKYEQTNLTEPTVVLLGPDAALWTATAKLDVTFEGRSLSGDAFLTSVMIKKDGKWVEQFFQVTSFEP
jgi:ketosteroid isomerase-like protein